MVLDLTLHQSKVVALHKSTICCSRSDHTCVLEMKPVANTKKWTNLTWLIADAQQDCGPLAMR